MSEKNATVQPPAMKPPACRDCALGIPMVIPNELKRKVQCRAGACAAVSAQDPRTQSLKITFIRPVWNEDDWCFLFTPRPREAQNS